MAQICDVTSWVFENLERKEASVHFIFKLVKLVCSDFYVNELFKLDANKLVYDQNHYYGLGLIPKSKLANTFDWYRNKYRNHILKRESSYW